jgi:FkbM family methyltransferase|tara:strand:- start:263 stop:1021 length:759 start_codon:yes stop_codon:yes gene_type:complete
MNFKLLKKIVGIFGFKLIDKNLVKNERLVNDNSFFSLNSILNKLFIYKLINNVIQIGANDGKRFDEINFFIKKFKTKAILIEPIKKNFLELKKNYKNSKNIIFENSAITKKNDIIHLFKVKDSFLDKYDNHVKGLNSFDIKHLLKHGVKKKHIIKEKVFTLTFNELLKKYHLKKLDLLFIDAEGYDGDLVIEFLKLKKFRPIIIFEYIHINNDKLRKLIFLLKKYNFYYFDINENMICFPIELKKIKEIINL